MSPLLAALICIAAYVVAYRVYARFLAERVFLIDPARPTPAVRFRDEIDYVPANRYVLFGHQYASITGLSPMLGPRESRSSGAGCRRCCGSSSAPSSSARCTTSGRWSCPSAPAGCRSGR